MDVQSRRRVKLYVLNEERMWSDQGTGHVSSVFLDKFNGMSLIVRSEDDGRFHKLQLSCIYWQLLSHSFFHFATFLHTINTRIMVGKTWQKYAGEPTDRYLI
jgi:hypothetical protein